MSDSSDTTGTTVDQDENVTCRKCVKQLSTGVDTPPSTQVWKLKVPTFSPEDPELWFAMLEGQFERYGITDDSTKFNIVTNHLDMQYAKSVKDIIINPPPTHRYKKIKTELIKRLSDSHERKVKQLLTHEELGDRKPSQFLRHLQDLAGPSVPEDFLKSIWSNRLPQNIQTVLASQTTHSLEQLADLADRIQELTSPMHVAAMTAHTNSVPNACSEVAELKKMVEILTKKLDEHTNNCRRSVDRSRPRDRYRSTSRQRNRSSSSYQKYPLCWYHSTHGAKARKCVKPCDFNKAENSMGSR